MKYKIWNMNLTKENKIWRRKKINNIFNSYIELNKILKKSHNIYFARKFPWFQRNINFEIVIPLKRSQSIHKGRKFEISTNSFPRKFIQLNFAYVISFLFRIWRYLRLETTIISEGEWSRTKFWTRNWRSYEYCGDRVERIAPRPIKIRDRRTLVS